MAHNPHDRFLTGFPPPPPPPRPGQPSDVQSLNPPPPPFASTGFQTMYPTFQQVHHTTSQQNYGMPMAPNDCQIHQYQYPQNFYNHQYNYASPPPPPPPPPPQQKNIKSKPDATTTSNPTTKKINQKMAKKYSGRGLKTITISGPGMPTQKFKICVGNHPDDVKKWIEERRKRFPRTSGAACSSNNATTSASSTYIGQKRDMEDSQNAKFKKQCTDGSVEGAGAISSLLAGYASSSSEEGEELEVDGLENNSHEKQDTTHEAGNEQSQSSNPSNVSATAVSSTDRVCKFFKRGKCRHGDSCKFLHTIKPDDKDSRENKRTVQSEQDKSRRNYERELQALGLVAPGQSHRNGQRHTNSASLLNKLLQSDKERERRLTLQLLRYIVDRDFFQGNEDGSNTTDAVTSGEGDESR